MNTNDKVPIILPYTQRTNVTEAAYIGQIIHKMTAVDPDATPNSLIYEVTQPISAIDIHGHPVNNDKIKVGKCMYSHGRRRRVGAPLPPYLGSKKYSKRKH